MASLLLIDGDRNFREALAVALRLDGCAVTCSPGAAEGAALLRRGGYDLCLVDLTLGGAEVLLAEAVGLGLMVVVTGPYLELLESAARRHRGLVALQKPVTAADLLTRLATA
jgi:DNA-binding NtrC family response regulator